MISVSIMASRVSFEGYIWFGDETRWAGDGERNEKYFTSDVGATLVIDMD